MEDGVRDKPMEQVTQDPKDWKLLSLGACIFLSEMVDSAQN